MASESTKWKCDKGSESGNAYPHVNALIRGGHVLIIGAINPVRNAAVAVAYNGYQGRSHGMESAWTSLLQQLRLPVGVHSGWGVGDARVLLRFVCPNKS